MKYILPRTAVLLQWLMIVFTVSSFSVSVQVEELKSRLMAAEKAMGSLENTAPVKTHRVQSKGVSGSPAALPQKPLLRAESGGTETQERKVAPATGVSLGF